MTNAEKLAAIGGGGTNTSAPVKLLNKRDERGDAVIFISDNQSWVDARRSKGATALMEQWNIFRKRNPLARLICIDIQPYGDTQALEREDILNVGGFSDAVFEVVGDFIKGFVNADHWVEVIKKRRLEGVGYRQQ
jgi:60 kDa SS-A/Ro ribonucleoprotein